MNIYLFNWKYNNIKLIFNSTEILGFFIFLDNKFLTLIQWNKTRNWWYFITYDKYIFSRSEQDCRIIEIVMVNLNIVQMQPCNISFLCWPSPKNTVFRTGLFWLLSRINYWIKCFNGFTSSSMTSFSEFKDKTP